MLLHVVFRQFDTNGETLDDQNDAREFEGDLVGVAPGERVYEVRGMRTEDDAADGGHGGFANVQSLLDEGGAEHEKRREAAQDDVHQVRLVDR